jgi:hypothetical protein
MKAKKALKRLTRVEALLSDVLKQYSAGEKEVRESLDSAKAAVARAWESVNRKVSAALEKKPAATKPGAKKKAASKSAVKAKSAKRPAQAAKAKGKPAVAAKKEVAKAAPARKRRVIAKRKSALRASNLNVARSSSSQPSPTAPKPQPGASEMSDVPSGMTASVVRHAD